jgi:16S rRNA (adenine1518-N6/adenine1519-N6)-dimethyltransferase
MGQHFLKSKKIINEIVKAAEIKKGDLVLEVGPGRGILTEALLKKAGEVIAVEKDKSLAEFLKEKFKNHKNLKLIHGDILKFKNLKLIGNWKLEIGNYKVVANLPYYITSHFLRQFLTTPTQPELMVLMLQKEVAQRITAKNGRESLLSISVKAYGWPKIIKTISKKYFSPAPKVDSAIIKIDKISKNFFNAQNVRGSTSNILSEKGFFDLVRKGFSQKRKMLKNNLKISAEALKKCGLNEKVRAEELSLKNWERLYIIHNRKFQS